MQVCARLSALTDELWQAGDPVLKSPTAHTVSSFVLCVLLCSGIHTFYHLPIEDVISIDERLDKCIQISGLDDCTIGSPQIENMYSHFGAKVIAVHGAAKM